MSCTANSKYGIKELVPLTEGCSGYSRFTRPWTEYLYGKLLADADIGVGEGYKKGNSTRKKECKRQLVKWWKHSIITVGREMSCIANSQYGMKELSAISDSGMLLPYL